MQLQELWPLVMSAVGVVAMFVRVQQAQAQAVARLEKLDGKLDSFASRLTELDRMITEVVTRQRDVDRLEREIHDLKRRLDRAAEHIASLRTHLSDDRASDPGPVKSRESDG